MTYAQQLSSVSTHLGICRERDVLAAILPDTIMDVELWHAIIGEAARFAEDVLAPIDPIVDAEGCRLKNGRVSLPEVERAAWDAFAANGWMSLTIPEAYGGQGMPMLLLAAVHEFFERGCVAFCMVPGGTRAASRLLEAHASEAVRAEWLPRLASGEWTATICISEADAGSDVGRARGPCRRRTAPGASPARRCGSASAITMRPSASAIWSSRAASPMFQASGG